MKNKIYKKVIGDVIKEDKKAEYAMLYLLIFPITLIVSVGVHYYWLVEGVPFIEMLPGLVMSYILIILTILFLIKK